MSFVVVLPARADDGDDVASLFERTSDASGASAPPGRRARASRPAPRLVRRSDTRVERDEEVSGPASRESAVIRVISPPPSSARARARDLVPRERDHRRPPQRLARDLAVVERRDDAADVLPCSWPLPAMTTTSPVVGECDRTVDRAPAVGIDLDVEAGPCRRPG
jgi:hypothetical protein